MIKLVMHPIKTSGGYRYRVERDGVVLVEASRVPLSDACRVLAGQGETGPVEIWRPDTKFPAMSGIIEKLAKRTVRENSQSGPRFVDWHPFEGL